MSLDPLLIDLRRDLRPFHRRLWLRRVVRGATRIAAAVAVGQLLLALVARLMPFEWHAYFAMGLIVAGLAALAVYAVRVRPTLGEAALAVDSEQGRRR